MCVACMFAEPANTLRLCLSSCEQHEAYQTATAVVCSAEAEQREAEQEQEAEGADEPDEKSSSEDGESDAQGEGGTGSTARQGKRARRQGFERFSPEAEDNRPQLATAKKKHQTRDVGYRDDDVDALFRGEVEKFTSSLATQLARR